MIVLLQRLIGNYQFFSVPWNFLFKSKNIFYLQQYFIYQRSEIEATIKQSHIPCILNEKEHIQHINFQLKASNKYNHKD